MKLDRFINRPVLSTVISILIVILGLIGLATLPITQYPDIAPPTVSVRATYQGANAQTVLNSVIAPLEDQINGVENMMYMTSSASNNGSAEISIYFKQGTDPDMAAVNVQNRVSMAQGLLPAEVTKVGVTTQKRQTSMLMVFSIYDEKDQYDIEFLENYANINLIPEVKRVNGVGDATVLGQDYSMRIWLKPDVMAQYKLIPNDVAGALAEQNIEAAPGQFGERGNQSFQYTIRYKGRLQQPEEFENIVIKALENGEVLRLKDIADIELGRLSYNFNNMVNSHKAVSCIVYQMAGTNATQTISDLEEVLGKASETLPSGLKINIAQSANDFLFASIHEVIKTLIEAFILVFIVVYIFLQDMRSTLIPAIAIPVALIATFFVLQLIGFSINLLTLSAMVLAIAIVVDDAIVVVEGVHAKLDQGYKSARTASIDAMSELGGAIISITLVMMSVFVPVSFMGGTAGTFYRQFGLTMAIAIGFSALNALTLSPALCAIFLKPHNSDATMKERIGVATKEARKIMIARYVDSIGRMMRPGLTLLFTTIAILGMIFGLFSFENHPVLCLVMIVISVLALAGMTTDKFKHSFNASYDSILGKYKKQVLRFIQKKWLSGGIVVGSIVLLMVFMNITPTGMVPNEDTGTIMGVVTLPPGTSQERAMEVLNRVDSLVAADPAVESRTVISGFSFIGGQGPSYGSLIIKLKNWEERSTMQNSTVVYATLFMRAQKIIKEAQVLFFAPPMIPGYSASSDIELNMQDKTGGDLNHFFDVVNDYTAALEARPEINSAKTSFNPNFPQYMLDIDAAACKKAGLSPSDILSTMQGYFGGLYASNFNSFGKMYRVMIQAEPNATKNLESLSSIKVRNGNEMAPITQFVSVKKVYGPDIISRFNLYTSMKVMVAPASGYTSGQALAAIAEVAKENLPAGFAYELGGMAREEAETSGSTTGLIFVLCFVFVYLLLSAQYESYILPLSVLLSVPFGLLGSFLFVSGIGSLGNIPALKMILGTMSNDIYMQIALIMLMGLLAKNAILIVEFALDRRKMGMSITWAAVLGAAARLRPILMTSLAMIVGLLPLMFASGAGANGNRTLGTSAIGGMLIGMILQIFIVPALFVAFQYLQEKVKPMEWEDVDNSDAEPEIEQYTK
ncbi:efflux RND transporter permease subunit [Bacteroides stercoris]|jgi:HAE1 family hydrophobic/amphiphilic exporter-1|uniref:AcrB/AcrD/AcrF family protein n=1 Tax=Bacteroides stercoris TaxID=46506 RepID=A0A412DRX8_BACSE|nr:efflux RND transporter permease subunit [Bacteroides stercoris]MDC2314170.1 efflux RND transporter permease subunit [Bacteroides stercoris]MDC2317299.1 efflux RND transporter permease subunit [Bacteroides stercoris]MDC2320387.1 efflux RND transporter permease subunit [Bacteroides stercoris]MDC2323583.1 efflux RND transporter permease subunit [Bacteroides stercoris]MDC2326830.1 efflux RND transporter permease subunit [Bacteroides stercoris]